MAEIVCDSELMTNYVAAVPTPAGSRFVTILDEKRQPIVISLSNDATPKLQVLRRDELGQSSLFDLGPLIGIGSDASIQHFQVEQGWDMSIFLCVATKASATTSNLIIVKPFGPKVLKPGETLGVVPSKETIGTVQRIHMEPASTSALMGGYPSVYAVHNSLDASVSWGSDIAHIRVSTRTNEWTRSNEFSPPENTDGIIGIAPGSNPLGKGLYILYKARLGAKLVAILMRPDSERPGKFLPFRTSVACPKDATAIATFVSPRGYTEVLIAASDGIRHLNTGEATETSSPGTLVFPGKQFASVRSLTVAQDGGDLTLWYQTARKELGYLRTKSTAIAAQSIGSLLLPAGRVTSFAACVTKPSDLLTGGETRQFLVTNDKSGNLTLLEQSSGLGMWRTTPFYAPSPTSCTPVDSYTVTIRAIDSSNRQPLADALISVSASSTVAGLVNGENLVITEKAQQLLADDQGLLNLIIPTTDLAAQVLRIGNVQTRDGVDLVLDPVSYDPAKKPMDKMRQALKDASTSEKLSDLKAQDGAKLLDSDVTQDTKLMRGAHSALQQCVRAYDVLPSNGSSVNTASVSEGIKTAAVSAQGLSDSLAELTMDAFHWATETLADIGEWFIETAGNVWSFVCNIAGEIKKFVLDCAEKICAAASWVWEKLKVGWQKLKDWLGFIFNWGDVLETKTTISTLITAGVGLAGDKMDTVIGKVDGVFDSLEDAVDKFGNSIKSDRKLSDSKSEDGKIKEVQNSTSSNWAMERMKNGGGASQTTMQQDGQSGTEAKDFWKDEVTPALTKIGDEILKVAQDMAKTFTETGSITFDQVVDASKVTLKAGINTLRLLTKGLLRLVKKLLVKLGELGNKEINVPIFTWLYKLITKGDKLTLFNFVGLIIAIPTTIFAKIITGAKPPQIANLNKELLGKIMSNDATVDAKVKNDFDTLKAEVGIGLTMMAGLWSGLKLIYTMVTGDADGIVDELATGPSSLFDVFGIVADFIGCIVSFPTDDTLPGSNYRKLISSVSLFRGAYHVVGHFSGLGKKAARVWLIIDQLTVNVQLGLAIAVLVEERKAKDTWKDWDEDQWVATMASSGLNYIAGAAYFIAFFCSAQAPPVAVAAGIVMSGTILATAITNGAVFKKQFDDNKAKGVLMPSSVS